MLHIFILGREEGLKCLREWWDFVMPGWDLHAKYAKMLWGIDSRGGDRFVDGGCHHDIGRFIVGRNGI